MTALLASIHKTFFGSGRLATLDAIVRKWEVLDLFGNSICTHSRGIRQQQVVDPQAQPFAEAATEQLGLDEQPGRLG
jgi:hypothetical protein